MGTEKRGPTLLDVAYLLLVIYFVYPLFVLRDPVIGKPPVAPVTANLELRELPKDGRPEMKGRGEP